MGIGKIKLSIIMPCFNVEKTLARALDSILRQKTDFDYEVLLIDDGSQDDTARIGREYVAKFPFVHLLENGRNLGNAKSFKKGLEAARGDYFTVLDGDDFYTVRDKLQKQVNFLDGDRACEYAAVAHKYLSVHPDGAIREDWNIFKKPRDYSFQDFLTSKFYFHTSTVMYRNYFRGMDIPVLEKQRGDTIRTCIAMNACYGKMKVLDFVGSAYFMNPEGIWTSLDEDKRKKVDLETRKSCLNYVESEREKKIIALKIREIAQKPVIGEERLWTPDQLLQIVRKNFAEPYAFNDQDFIFRKLYKSEFADSLCESVGYAQYCLLGLAPVENPDPHKAVILISVLNRTGGGIYREIVEMLEAMRTREVRIVVTDMKQEELSEEATLEFSAMPHVGLTFFGGGKKEPVDRLAMLEGYVHSLKAGRIYYYCGHNNTLVDAALQDYGAKNIIPFSFDHGLSLGLDNSNIDLIIAKTPKDYRLLDKNFHDRAIYIPCWSKPPASARSYKPLSGKKLKTATAAARFYKYEGDILGKFEFLIVYILKVTGGSHVHYGPLPARVKASIHELLERNGIRGDRFEHVEWADDLAESMLEKAVDLFISPFPISSIKLNLQCEAAGVPMLVYDGGLTRIEKNDFLHPDVLRWKSRKEFFDILAKPDASRLKELSRLGREYFASHNDLSLLAPYILFDRCFESVPLPPPHVDRDIIDIRNVQDLLAMG